MNTGPYLYGAERFSGWEIERETESEREKRKAQRESGKERGMERKKEINIYIYRDRESNVYGQMNHFLY